MNQYQAWCTNVPQRTAKHTKEMMEAISQARCALNIIEDHMKTRKPRNAFLGVLAADLMKHAFEVCYAIAQINGAVKVEGTDTTEVGQPETTQTEK